MLRGFPTFKLATDLAPLDIQKESVPGGAAMRTDLLPVKRVVLEGQALLRIIKHVQANPSRRVPVFGQVLGLQVGNTVEVTAILPNIRTNTFGTNISDNERDAMDKRSEEQMLKFMTQSGMDGNVVGRYARTSHGEWTRNLSVLDRCISEGISPLLITYDPDRTAMGKLAVRAFTAGPAYLAYCKQKAASGKGASAALFDANFNGDGGMDEDGSPLSPASGKDFEGLDKMDWDNRAESLMTEVPIELHNSTAQNLILASLASRPRGVVNTLSKEPPGPYVNRQMERLTECLDSLQIHFSEPAGRSGAGENVSRLMDATITAAQLKKRAEHLKNVAGGIALNVEFVRKLTAAPSA